MNESLYKINRLCMDRYMLTLPKTLEAHEQHKAYMNHMFFWANLNKVILHSTSKKILNTPELYGSQSLAFSCIGGQTPKPVKSKQSVAAFKVMAGTLVGATSHLRKHKLQSFCYKWTFLAAGVDRLKGSVHTNSIGLPNVFFFELDQLDYNAFEPLPGLHIEFSGPSKSIT